MLGLDTRQQAYFVGIRSTFYRIATIAGQGLLIMLAGVLERITGRIPYAWSLTFLVMAGVFVALWAYHQWILPYPKGDGAMTDIRPSSTIWKDFVETLTSFFKKKGALSGILFMLLYRLPEAQLGKMCIPFLVDPVEKGGLGMSIQAIGFAQGTVGIIGLTMGGIVGGMAVARHGLKRWLWPMVAAISLPDAVYVYLSYAQPTSLPVINLCLFTEQLGYGFGFTAYMLFLIQYADGEHKTAHYAVCTAFMALGMMIPGMAAGWIQETLGYQGFFLWIMGCCLVTALVSKQIKLADG
jgi:PAT family beta-lactamase induction signal transducer AmpG